MANDDSNQVAIHDALCALYDDMSVAHYALLFMQRSSELFPSDVEKGDPTFRPNIERIVSEKGTESSDALFGHFERLCDLLGVHMDMQAFYARAKQTEGRNHA